MNRTDCITDRPFNDLSGFKRCLDSRLHIAHVVHGIEYSEDVDAPLGGPLDESLHYIVRVVMVSNEILAADEHLKTRARHRLAKLMQPLPRRFLQIAKTGIEGGSAPHLDRPVTHLVEVWGGATFDACL